MRLSMIAAVAFALAMAGTEARAQQSASSVTADSSASVNALALPRALPPALVPARGVGSAVAFVQEESQMVPVLFGIFGGIAGMFAADWWADRECGDCGQTNIPMLFLGGALGAMIGYLIGGGEIPDEPPPGR